MTAKLARTSCALLGVLVLLIHDISGSAYGPRSRFSNRIHGAGNKDALQKSALENRMSVRQDLLLSMQIPLIRCKPDVFPNLLIAGFCSDTADLFNFCFDLEISTANACAQLDGSFCCYISPAQGNSLTSVIDTITTSPTTTVQASQFTDLPSTTSSTFSAPSTAQQTAVPVTSTQTTTSSTSPTTTTRLSTAATTPTTTSTTVTSTPPTTTPTTQSTTTRPSTTTTLATTTLTTTTPTTTRTTTITTTPTTTQTTARTTTTTPTTTTTTPTTARPTTVTTATVRPTNPPVTTATIPPQCVSQLNTSCPNTQQVILDAMNAIRRKQGAADMFKMVWDNTAALVAQTWAEGCSFQHGPAIKPTSTFASSGQNIAAGSGSFFTTWSAVIDGPLSWNSEAQFTTIGAPCPTDHDTGHFTQDIWAKSFQIGCGFAQCGSTRNFVCNFGPAGNFGNPCVAPFTPGTAQNGGVCGFCGGINSAKCDNGLCNNPCPFTNDFTNCNNLIPNSQTCQNPSAQFVRNCTATCRCRDQGLLF